MSLRDDVLNGTYNSKKKKKEDLEAVLNGTYESQWKQELENVKRPAKTSTSSSKNTTTSKKKEDEEDKSLWKKTLDTITGIGGNFLMGVESVFPSTVDYIETMMENTVKTATSTAIEKILLGKTNLNDETKKTISKVGGNVLGGIANSTLNPYSEMNAELNSREREEWRTNTIRSNIEKSEGKVGKYLAELAPNLGQNAVNMGLTAVNPVLGTIMFMTSASGNYLDEARARGMDDDSALAYSTVMGSIEGLTERLISGQMLSAGAKIVGAKALTKETIKSITKTYGFTIGENFLQEAVTEPLNELTAQVTAGKEYADWDDIVQRSFKAGFDGAVSAVILGGMSAGVSSAVRVYNKMQNGEQVTQEEITEAINDSREAGIPVDQIAEQNVQEATNIMIQQQLDKQNAEAQEQGLIQALTEKQKEYLEAQDPREQQIIQEEINILNEELNEIKNAQQFTDTEQNVDNKERFVYTARENDSDITKAVYESASRVMDNSKASHVIADFVAKVAEDRGTIYEFVDSETLKQLGHSAEGKVINGLVTDEGKVLINIESKKALETVVGHETTHLLEGTKEYQALQDYVVEYAKQKGIYEEAYSRLEGLYKGKKADINAELTADLVGELLFSDTNFVKELSVQNRTVFEKIYDYIKHLYKMATAGSKEARQLEQLKYKFEEAYKAEGTKTKGETQYSFGGVNSKTADKQALLLAEKMEEQGKSAKEIYQATGWFRGNENKWRYEISNEDSTIVDKVKGHSWDSIEAEINKRNIEKKLAYHQKRFDKNVLKDYEVLEKEQEFIRKYSEELAQINEILENSKVNLDVSTLYNSNLSFKDIYKLNEILQNDELFEAYPQLKEVNIHMPKSYYSPDNSGTLAFVTDNSATDIYLTERGLRNKEDLKSTLLHEIQHLIQHTEGFSSGASMENWYDYKRNEIDKKINTLNEKIEKQIGNEFVFWETAKRMYRLEELTTTIEKSKKEISKYEAAIERGDGWSYRFQAMIETAQVDIERAEIEYEAIEEALKTTIGENNLNEYKGYLEELKDYMLGRGTKAYELYKNTAGEIEAREVEKRIDYTAEQRKNEMPFVKDENTVYADFETDSQAKYSISATDNRRKLSISNPLAEKHYNKILQIFNENNGDTSLIDYIGANDVYKRDSQGNRVYKTFAEYENLANINKERELARQKFNEEENKRYEQRKQWEEQHKQEIMERDGISEQQYQKEREAEIYREEKQKELALLSREIRDKESGYHNNQKSIRAIRAELDGKFPLTVASKMLGVSEKSIKNNVVVSEWHHSGGEMYNEIDYYDISKYIDLADNGIDEYINDSNYQQEISNWLKMRNSTKTINDFTTDPDIRYSLSEDTEGRKLSKEQIERYKYVSEKLKDENGRLKPYYHGTQRADRVGTYFDPERATSGPMAFFTDSKEIGQNYSENKSDTSLSREYDTEYDLFKADGKDLDTYWNSLSKAEQQKINKEGNNVGFADDWENIVYGDRASENSFSDMYKWYLNNETNGNGIKALYNVWVQDGNIMGDDLYKFQEVLEKAGLKNVEFLDPYKVDSKVYEVYLNITNPFDTSDISEDIVQQFKEASKTATIGEQYSADAWDKTNITPEQWISKLESDIAENTTHAWTVIPDWVTSVLKKNGYDGIVDTGGKGGGVGHQVVIPFYSEQIKDVSNQQPTDNPNIDMSLSYDDEAPVKNPNLTYGEDIKYRVEEAIAPLQETIENLTEQVKAMQENIAPTSQEVVEQQGQESSDFLDAPIDKVFADFDYSTYYGKIQKEAYNEVIEIYNNAKKGNIMKELIKAYTENEQADRIVTQDTTGKYMVKDKQGLNHYTNRGESILTKQNIKDSLLYDLIQRKGKYEGSILETIVKGFENTVVEQPKAVTQNPFELTEEQVTKIQELRDDTKKWKQIYSERYDDKKFAEKRIKGVAMQNAAEIREITQGDWLIPIEGGLTEIELNKKINRLNSNYIGKNVLVNGKDAVITGNAYGKVGVEFSDGSIQYVEKNLVQPAEDVNALIQEQQRMYEQYQASQPNIAPEPIKTSVEAELKPSKQVVPSKEKVAQKPNTGVVEGKQRKWIKTSTESEVVNRQILPDDLDQTKIMYQPITNRDTLNKANTRLNTTGYEKSLEYFNNQIQSNKVSVEDIALGERLIQEALRAKDTKTAGELIQNVAILGTELGQKVQALSIIKRMTPEGQLKMLEKVVNRGKIKGDKAFEGVQVTEEMKDKILKTYNENGSYDQDALNKVVEEVKQDIAKQMEVTAMDKVNAWRYLSMLGNPKTHVRNLVSNLAMKGTLAVKNAVARTIEDIAPIENKTKTWKQASQEVADFAKQTTLEMKDIISGDSKYSEESDIKSKREIFKNKVLNKLANLNSDLLKKEDWWFSKGAFESSFREFLTANGITTKEDIQKNPELIEKGKNYALEQSQIATFRQQSWLANKIGEIERKNAVTSTAVGAILPFKKTPINIAKAGLNYSPIGALKSVTYDLYQVEKGNMEASTAIDHIAQGATGTALTMIGLMLAQAGILNGAGDDDKEGKYDYQLGKQAYSLNIGDATYSLSWLSPVAMPLLVGANMYEQLIEKEEWNTDVVLETLGQTLDPLSEMSFLSSLDSVLSSYDSGVQRFFGIGEAMVQNYVTQFIPTASSQLAGTIDDTKRTTKVAGDSTMKVLDETYNKLIYKIPFLRQTLEPSIDIWGNEIKQTENVLLRAFENFISPYARKESIATDIDEELKDLYGQTGDTGVIPNIPYNYVKYDGEKHNMSAKEYTDFKKTYGQTANDMLEDLFRTTTYKEASSEDRADMVNDVFDYASDKAKKEYLAKENVAYTNATKEGVEYFKEHNIKGAIENDMTVDEYKLYQEKPEKYNFFKDNGISYEDYDNNKDLYNYAYEHQDKYAVSKAITDDFATYYSYIEDINKFDAKDENGETVSGLKKERVFDYINSLEMNIPQKVMMFKSFYPKDKELIGNEYNYEVLDYVNNLATTYEERVKILESIGIEVDSDGNVYWD